MRRAEPSRARPSAPAGRVATFTALAEEYLHVPDSPVSPDGTSFVPDTASATLYASLALSLEPDSVRARRLLAQCYMLGGAGHLFPFSPSSDSDSGAGHARAGALAAVHLLQHGTWAMFTDVAAARVYAAACTILGGLRDAQLALEWAANAQARPEPPAKAETPSRDIYTGQLRVQLGRIAMKQARYRDAADHFERARAADPYNWGAWTSLCDMSLAPPALDAFGEPEHAPEAPRTLKHETAKRTRAAPAPAPQKRVLRSRMREDVPPVPSVPAVPPAAARQARALSASRTNTSHTRADDAKDARRTRAVPKTRNALVAAADRARSPPPVPSPTKRPVSWLVQFLRAVGEAYRLVRLFRSKEAVALINGSDALAGYRDAAPMQCLLGRTLHDLSEYAAAETHFRAARALEPHLLAHMDIFSLVLFQLHREVELSALAQSLTAIDPRSTASHIAAGNTWSLQGEHDAAYACFQQAAIASPECAYAYTLAGYEALELDRPSRAVRLFRCARRCDRRHWNALAGLGHVYLRRGNAALASEAYAEAFMINSGNAVLLDLLGWALEQSGDTAGALAVYQRAIRMQPRAAMTRLKRAQLLLRSARAVPEADAAQRESAAHAELQRVSALAPLDAHVHVLLARSFMRRGGGSFARDEYDASTEAALPGAYKSEVAHHLAAAMHLDPASVRDISAMGDGRTLRRGGGGSVAEDADDSGIDGSALHSSYAYSWHNGSA